MTITLAFDVYGTLIDTHGMVSRLRAIIGDKASDFSQTWRNKQLEYSFRRGLMRSYKSFAVCTSDALDYTCIYYNTPLTKAQRQGLLANYRTLPAFTDVEDCLTRLKAANFRSFALSNGSTDAVEMLLETSGIRKYFLGIVSVNDLQTFKPNPVVYNHFLSKSGTSADNAWLISSNPFDVIGAISAGMNSAWIKRAQADIFDPWGIEPTLTLTSLSDLDKQITGYQSGDWET